MIKYLFVQFLCFFEALYIFFSDYRDIELYFVIKCSKMCICLMCGIHNNSIFAFVMQKKYKFLCKTVNLHYYPNSRYCQCHKDETQLFRIKGEYK